MLGITSLLVVFRGLASPPARDVTVTAASAAMWAALALKGAAAGKFKPGGYLGLRVYWTRHSRLAWDRAHRVLGRVLFWGGLTGLAANFVTPFPASIALFVATVVVAVSLALFVSWRTWRDDPDRTGERGLVPCCAPPRNDRRDAWHVRRSIGQIRHYGSETR